MKNNFLIFVYFLLYSNIYSQITPEITIQPINRIVDVGETVSFSVRATCDGPMDFQWWQGDTPIQWNNGDKNGRLKISKTTSSSTLTIIDCVFDEDNNNQFLCEVKNLNNYPADGFWVNTSVAKLEFEKIEFLSIPNILNVGDNYLISWLNHGAGSIKLEYSINSEKLWNLIADNIPETQTEFNWIIPNTTSMFCNLRIRNEFDSTIMKIAPCSNSFYTFEQNYARFIIKYENQWEELDFDEFDSINSLNFINKNHGYAWNNKSLIGSHDGGDTWDLLSNYENMNFDYVKFENLLFGWGCSIDQQNKKIIAFKTFDAGINWELFSDIIIPNNYHMIKCYFFNYKVWFIIFSGNEFFHDWQVLKTEDSGLNWKIIIDNDDERLVPPEINFTNENIGWMKCSIYGSEGGRVFFKTKNGGINWEYLREGNYYNLYMKDYNHVWGINSAVGSYNRNYIIFERELSENKWENQNSFFDTQDYPVYTNYQLFKDAKIGWMTAYSVNLDFFKINKTIDGGNTWELQYNDNYKIVTNLISPDGLNCWCITNDNHFLRYISEVPCYTYSFWNIDLIISERNTKSKIIQFGQSTEATYLLDPNIGESELTPLPPAGTFDVRFILENNSPTQLDLRNSDDTEIEWIIQFQPGSNGYPITFNWENQNLPFGSFFLQDVITGKIINIDMKLSNSFSLTNESINRLKIVYKEEYSNTVSYNKNWDLVSVPLITESNNLKSIFNDYNTNAFMFDGIYKSVNELESGKGHWLKFNDNNVQNIYGEKIIGPIQVKKGWNLIGGYNEEIPISSITTNPSNIITSDIYGFNNSYFITDKLIPGDGYWVKMKQDGEITFNSNQSLSKKGEIKLSETEPFLIIPIKATDGINDTITLKLGIDSLASNGLEENMGEEELPPLPPLGVFDIRFALPDTMITSYNDIRYSEIGCKEHIIKYQLGDSSKGLRLNWKIPEGVTLQITDMFGGTIFNETFESGEGSYTISNANNNNAKLTLCYSEKLFTDIEEKEIPNEFSLSQNYPNPFNPTTKIKFGLPKESKVNLTVYNVLGEKLKEIVNQNYKAGYYEVDFNATSFSSGIYFYRLQAGHYIETKKMNFLK